MNVKKALIEEISEIVFGDEMGFDDLLQVLRKMALVLSEPKETVRFVKVHPDAKVPEKKLTASCYDLCAVEDRKIAPGHICKIGTGLKIELPPGFEAQVRSRSGLACNHGVTVANSPGTIDEDYRGEIVVALINHGVTDYYVDKGDRIAQLYIGLAGLTVNWEEVSELDSTERGTKGFGSTGR